MKTSDWQNWHISRTFATFLTSHGVIQVSKEIPTIIETFWVTGMVLFTILVIDLSHFKSMEFNMGENRLPKPSNFLAFCEILS